MLGDSDDAQQTRDVVGAVMQASQDTQGGHAQQAPGATSEERSAGPGDEPDALLERIAKKRDQETSHDSQASGQREAAGDRQGGDQPGQQADDLTDGEIEDALDAFERDLDGPT